MTRSRQQEFDEARRFVGEVLHAVVMVAKEFLELIYHNQEAFVCPQALASKLCQAGVAATKNFEISVRCRIGKLFGQDATEFERGTASRTQHCDPPMRNGRVNVATLQRWYQSGPYQRGFAAA